MAATSALACASPSLGTVIPATPVPFRVSSGAIRYTIRGEFEGSVAREADGLVVTITKGLIVNDLRVEPPHSPLWQDLRLQVLIAQPRGASWSAVAESAPVLVASSFDADTTVRTDTIHVQVARVAPSAMSRAWLVIRMQATPLAGTPFYREPNKPSSTYACSAEFLDGRKREGVAVPFKSPIDC
ncbi:MAG TPA: hypothetical protein VFK26_03135 [Gemmatimonadaceae bacterium]|nr:hypothetical protein [Gemmatimonadaceae bacterium]